MLRFRYLPIKYNHSSRNGQSIKYLAIHDTGNAEAGANAYNHYKYFGGGDRRSSAHYFVDDKEIIQIIWDSRASWAVGDNQGYGRALNGVTNYNSISIELCINSDGNYQVAYRNLVELVKNLMVKFNIPLSNVCRHYDVSRKRCPGTFFANNWTRWKEFLVDIQKPLKIKLDLDKDSVGVEVDKEVEVKPPTVIEPEKPIHLSRRERNEIVKTTLGNFRGVAIHQSQLYLAFTFVEDGQPAKNCAQLGTPCANAALWSGSVNKKSSCCVAAAVNGVAIGPNSFTNFYPDNSIKRATFVIHEDYRITCQRINSIDEIKGKTRLIIGGANIYPDMDNKLEGWDRADSKNVVRSAKHTVLAYVQGKIRDDDTLYVLVNEKNRTIEQLRAELIKVIPNLTSAIMLDGGGSSQFYVDEDFKSYSSRAVNTVLGFTGKIVG